jgi:hypothetical protein
MSVDVLQEGCEAVSPHTLISSAMGLTEATQFYVKFPDFEDWIQSYLLPIFRTAYICLRPGCYCITKITSTPSDVVLAGLEEAAPPAVWHERQDFTSHTSSPWRKPPRQNSTTTRARNLGRRIINHDEGVQLRKIPK